MKAKCSWLLSGLAFGSACLVFFTFSSRMAQAGEWYETIKVYGDLRFRHESFQTEKNNLTAYDYRDRQRVRARLGVMAPIDDYWLANVRVATDEAHDPISTNQTLGDYFTRKPFELDLAYLEYKVLFNNLKLTAGKMNNPFEIVGKSQLLWDSDLTPEGMAGNFKMDLMQDTSLFVNGGGFWVKEVSTSYDPMIYAAQVGCKTKFSDMKLTAGFGYIYYTDITRQYVYDYKASNTATASAYGNTMANGRYKNNYMLGNGFIDFGFNFMDFPVKLYIDYVLNNGANAFNRGYLAGLVFNKAAGEGTWEIGYNFRQLQKDAAVGAFCDSDFIGGGTNGEGHQLTATYVVVDNVKTTLTFFRDRKAIDTAINPFYNRFQADVALAF